VYVSVGAVGTASHTNLHGPYTSIRRVHDDKLENNTYLWVVEPPGPPLDLDERSSILILTM
jgi:hypothetical protein